MFKKIRENFLFAVIACIVLAVSVVTLVTPAGKISERYDDNLTQMPELTLDSYLDGYFLEMYEQYLSDQIWRRDDFLSVKSLFEYLMLKTESNGVAYGEDRFMFSKFYSFPPEILTANLNAIDLFAYNTVSETSVMVVPSSSYPLVDYLPDNMPIMDQGYYINEINEYLSNTTTPINVKDVLAINANKYIYYRTDPNWTTYGAWLGYTQLTALRGLKSFKYDSDTVKKTSVHGFYGSNYTTSKAFNVQPDTIEYFNFPASVTTLDGTVYEDLYNYSAFESNDKYSGFIHGSRPYAVINSEQSASKKGTIVVMCDSLGYSFVPFLTQNYNEVIMIDLRYYDGSFEDIKTVRYDDVIILLGFETLCTDAAIANLK
jgi:hypothetical protein